MKEQDQCQPCTGNNQKVYIYGSATTIGASAYAGWGMWSPDNPKLKEHGALKGRYQGSDTAEVRALVSALGKSIGGIEVITDSQSVRDTANYIITGGVVHTGKHSDLCNRIRTILVS
eukprot:16439702-Heterocapsa_arctica.AAC.2